MTRGRRVYLAALAALCVSTGACATLAAAAVAVAPHARSSRACANTNLQPTRRDLRLIRAATLCLVNRERAARGERPLRMNRRLVRAAQSHSQSMSVQGYFAHVGSAGETPLQRMRAAGYIHSSHIGYEVGENIAWGTTSLATPRAIVAAWMASPAHRANILDARFRDTGIGVSAKLPRQLAGGLAGGIYTQDFGVIVRG